jgi:hypothetical protein
MKFTIEELTQMLHGAVLDAPVPAPLRTVEGIREVLRLAILGAYCELHHRSPSDETRGVE